jgi:transposase-like protein
VTVYRWVQRFAPEFAQAARARQHVVGDRRHVDETYLRIGGTWHYLCRAIDQFGQVIDVYLSPRRDANAARLFFAQAIGRTRISPVEVTTDRYRLYPRVLDEMLPGGLPRHAGPRQQSARDRPRMAEGTTPAHAGAEA